MIPRSVEIKIIFLVDGDTFTELSLIDSVSCLSWDPGSLSSGAGVISYIHEKNITAGKPRMTSITTNDSVQGGKCKAGNTMFITCSNANAKAAYIAMLLKTFRFFKSFIILSIFGNYDTLYCELRNLQISI